MKQINRAVFILLTFGLLFGACGQEEPAAEQTAVAPARAVPVPAFNRDSAYNFVVRQLDFGPRVPGSEAHRAARDWLADKLRGYGAEVVTQDFTARTYAGQRLPATNIIGQFNPGAGKRILLAAHWDTRFIADSPLNQERRDEPVPGADDGASGVAVLLEIARQLQANPIDIGVDIVFFDAEDQGQTGENGDQNSWGLGAQHWSRQPHRAGYKPQYGILLDMVGARNARFPIEYHSRQFAAPVVAKVWKLAADMGYGNYFIPAEGGAVTDDHYFVNTIAGIPMIDIINQSGTPQTGSNFGPHWHTHDDDLEVIDARTLRAVGQVVLAVIYREQSGTL